MKKTKYFLLFLGFILRAAIGFTASTPSTLSVGETLTFDVGWKAATAGTLVMKVEEMRLRQTRPAYRLVLEAATNTAIDMVYRVRDRIESWFDSKNLCSSGYSHRIDEGGRRKQQDVFINLKTGEFKSRSMRPDKNPVPEIKTGAYPSGSQDYLSVLYYFRLQPLQVGKIFPAVVVGGDNTIPIALKILKRETVSVPAGTYSCFVGDLLLKTDKSYEAHPKGRVTIWFAEDKKHMPVQIVAEPAFGRVEAKLASFSIP